MTTDTVHGFFNQWLAIIKTKRKPKTHACYSDTVRLYITPHLSNGALKDVTPLDIEAVLLALGTKSARVRQLTHAVLRAAFAQALAWRLIPYNPVSGVEAPRVPKATMKVWTAEEAKKFLASSVNDRLGLLYKLALETGWREGELLGLHWSDINFTDGTLTCNRTLTELEGRFSFGLPKTSAGKRTVTLGRGLLQDLITAHENSLPHWDLDGTPNRKGMLFTTREGTPHSKSNFRKEFLRAVKKAGVPVIRFHDLRHTNAVLCLTAGVDANTVAGRLGHSDPRTTVSIYGKFTKAGDSAASKTISNILGG